MFDRFGYKSALYLSALIAAANGSYFIYSISHFPSLGNGVSIYLVAAVAILGGLWLSSKVARYAGAFFYFFTAGAAAFPFLTSSKAPAMSVAIVWVVSMGVLSLCNALILIFSKTFTREFEAEREKRPTYKRYLAGALAILVGGWFVVATSIDLFSLASK
jgi:hypothetical protein